MIYFTSDLHLGHRGIITMQNRPFKTVEEMNRILIQNFNACVGKGDTVCILGDICHHMPVEAANDTISSLHGTKYLVKGNHDKKYAEGLFEDICDFKVTSLKWRSDCINALSNDVMAKKQAGKYSFTWAYTRRFKL